MTQDNPRLLKQLTGVNINQKHHQKHKINTYIT